MAKVLLRSTGRSGGTKNVDRRLAEVLVKRGGWEYADVSPAPPAPPPPVELESRSYNELRALAKEQELHLGRATKAELLAALEGDSSAAGERDGEAEPEDEDQDGNRSGTYRRRDMRAEP